MEIARKGDSEIAARYPAMPGAARRAVLLRQIDAYIGDHLTDPALAPATIAAAHFISKRYLFALFSEQGTTVAAHIRALRLERCRTDLADPSLVDHAVGLIGTRWGFSSAAHFSRVFRHAHGVPPGEYRLLAVQ
jgi:AraC-like DNA-binding protein